MKRAGGQNIPKWGWALIAFFGLVAVASLLDKGPLPSSRSPNQNGDHQPAQQISAFLPIAPAPLDQQPRVAFDFGNHQIDAVLTASGYPVVTMTLELPACATPWLAKEAGDAWRQKDQRWIDSLRDCVMLPAQTQAEWTRLTVPPDASELRLALRTGSRLTLYVPGFSTTGVADRFRYTLLSQARDAAKQREADKAGQ